MKRSLLRIAAAVLLCLSAASSQWLQTGGPYGATIYSLTTTGTTVIAATLSGIYRTTNDGVSWSQATGIPANVYVVKVLQANGGVYAATSSGPFLSTNSGVTWTALDSAKQTGYNTASFAKDSMLFAGTFHGMFRSSDNGKSWSTMDTSIGDREFKTFFAVGKVLFAGTTKGLFRSTNNGVTWKIADTLLNGNTWATDNAMIGSKLYVSASNGIYVSPDTGKTWASVKGANIRQIIPAIVSDGANLLAGTGVEGMYRSTDGGDTWVKTGALPTYAVNTIALRGTNIFAGTGWGISFSSNNGTTWSDMSTGITGTSVVMTGRVNGEFIALTSTSGMFTSVNNGLTWNPNPNSVKNVANYTIFTDTTSFRLSTNYGIYLSTDAGLTWNADTAGLGYYNTMNAFVKNGSVFCGGLKGVYERTVSGWSARNSGLPASPYVRSMTVSGTTMFAWINDSGLYRSTNKGVSWAYSGSGIPNNTTVNSFLVSGGTVYAAANSGVYSSTNNGTSWTKRSSPLPGAVYSLLMVNGNLFAGTLGYGAYVMKAKDTVWTAANTGMPLGNIITMYAENGTLFAGTGSGIWKRPLNEMITGVSTVAAAPAEFALQQNYPNPFNPSTMIRFSIAQSGPATLTVYDALGRSVATLVNERLEAGRTYEQRFDASHLASGIYYARLRSRERVQVMKMLLMK